MSPDDIQIGLEVICTKLVTAQLLWPKGRIKPMREGEWFKHRDVGHIGSIHSFIGDSELVFIEHVELCSDGSYTSILTMFHTDELEPFIPNEIPRTSLGKAIYEWTKNNQD